MSQEHRWNDTDNGKNAVFRVNPVPVPLSPIIIPTRTGLGFYLGLHSDRLLSDHLPIA